MAEILNAERDSDSQHNPKLPWKRKRKAKQKAYESDKDDADFMRSSSDSDLVSENDDTDCVEITNIKVCFYLTLLHILFSELLSKLTDSLPVRGQRAPETLRRIEFNSAEEQLMLNASSM